MDTAASAQHSLAVPSPELICCSSSEEEENESEPAGYSTPTSAPCGAGAGSARERSFGVGARWKPHAKEKVSEQARENTRHEVKLEDARRGELRRQHFDGVGQVNMSMRAQEERRPEHPSPVRPRQGGPKRNTAPQAQVHQEPLRPEAGRERHREVREGRLRRKKAKQGDDNLHVSAVSPQDARHGPDEENAGSGMAADTRRKNGGARPSEVRMVCVLDGGGSQGEHHDNNEGGCSTDEPENNNNASSRPGRACEEHSVRTTGEEPHARGDDAAPEEHGAARTREAGAASSKGWSRQGGDCHEPLGLSPAADSGNELMDMCGEDGRVRRDGASSPELLALSGEAAAGEPAPCFACGKPGHYARHCPKVRVASHRSLHGTKQWLVDASRPAGPTDTALSFLLALRSCTVFEHQRLSFTKVTSSTR